MAYISTHRRGNKIPDREKKKKKVESVGYGTIVFLLQSFPPFAPSG